MISRVHSFVLQGIDAVPCEIEVDLCPSDQPGTRIVGLPDTAVKESTQRVRTALRNSGFRNPRAHVLVNLAPAHIPKEGPVYDLPIAVALLRASGAIDEPTPGRPAPEDYVIAGELALDGRVRPVRGVISLAGLARRRQRRGVIVPHANASEASAVSDLEVLGVRWLHEVVALFNGVGHTTPLPTLDVEGLISQAEPPVDFGDVRGQEAAKRAMAVAAAGGHNVVMLGPPGTGKSMIARALIGILPPMTRDEVLEVTRIYSSAGKIPHGAPLVLQRPVRSPHHSASSAAIIGGGSIPRPGDVSLAHRGVLFLDEMPEFSRGVLETLRQPMEDGAVTIARIHGSVRFPARFMLVAALNPTARGDGVEQDGDRRRMERYLSRISRPLIDRIDLHVEVPAVPYKQLTSRRRGTDTASLRSAVAEARQRQRCRQGAVINAELPGTQLDRHAALDTASQSLLGQAMTELGLSARAYDKIRRMARTIADLEGVERLAAHHVAEAVQYRLLDRAE